MANQLPPNSVATKPANDASLKACLMANGLGYGPFREGQSPDFNVFPSTEQIDEDLKFLSTVTRKIRVYAASGRYSEIPLLAKRHSIAVTEGIHLGADKAENEREIGAAIHQVELGLVDRLVVGNEVLTGHVQGLSKSDLVAYIREVRKRVQGHKVEVSTAESWGVWMSNLDLADEVDFVMAHFYPFWENHPIDGAAESFFLSYKKLNAALRQRYPDRTIRIEVGESGWPSGGKPSPNAPNSLPSPENQRQYVAEFMTRACSNGIPFYYFDAFDEGWKWSEGQSSETTPGILLPRNRTLAGAWPGSSWGLFESDGLLKPGLRGLFPQPEPGSRVNWDIFADGQLSTYLDMGVDSSGKRRDWLSTEKDTLRMAYPDNQSWGAVFITVGEPGPRPHPWMDFSRFHTLSVELRGERGGETVGIGVMSYADPATGKERKVFETLTPDFRTYEIPLAEFASSHLSVPADLEQLYVLTEFVFDGPSGETVYARNIRFKP